MFCQPAKRDRSVALLTSVGNNDYGIIATMSTAERHFCT
jgi:hypothetical protein